MEEEMREKRREEREEKESREVGEGDKEFLGHNHYFTKKKFIHQISFDSYEKKRVSTWRENKKE